jgi:soluble lytic murein transglycosylase-like protein
MQVFNIPPPVSSAPNANAERARWAAKEFESLFASMLLRSMRSTVDDDPLVPRSFGNDVYTEMLDDEYAKQLANNGSLGLSDLILKQMGKTGDASSALDALNGLRAQSWQSDPRFAPQKVSAADTQTLRERMSAWDGFIDEASKRYGVDRDLIASVIAQESGGNPNAVSPKGAKGLMQLMDGTARDMQVARVFDPRSNIMGGTRYLRELLDKFNDERLALASYNAGPSAVEQHQGVPPYAETQNYVDRVLSLRKSFAAQGDGQ